MKKFLSLLLVTLFILLTACGGEKAGVVKKTEDIKEEVKEEVKEDKKVDEKKKETGKLEGIDLAGRTISLEKAPEKVVCIGPGVLRLYTYINGSDKVSGVEEIEKEEVSLKPYMMAYPEIKELETIGPGGPKNAPDAEVLSFHGPDIIYSTYGMNPEELDAFEKKVGAPVAVLSYGQNSIFEEDMYKSLELIGKLSGREERAKEIIDYMEGIKADLAKRSSGESETEVYIGGIGFRGRQGILSTRAKFNLLDFVNVKNIMDKETEERNVMLDKEKLLELNPEIIILDLDGGKLVREDYGKDKAFYDKLSAFANGKVYAILPYNNYTTNIETAMVDMYYIGKLIHETGFEDLNIEEKAGEIYKELLGKDVYPNMKEVYPDGLKDFVLE